MDILIRADTVEISGYVNAVERDSKPLWDRFGQFIERIKAGCFKRAIEANDDIHILLNHDMAKDLGSTKQGNLELTEDAIGLKARAIIKDPEVIADARAGRLVGWSFGFFDKDVEEGNQNGIRHRLVKDMDLREVSILNNKLTPAYAGTLINARAEGEQPMLAGEGICCDSIKIREEAPQDPEEKDPEPTPDFDNSKYKAMIDEMKS